MKNLAGDKECDTVIRQELIEANIGQRRVFHGRTEVPYTIIGTLGNWTFRRAWYYWVARSNKSPLEFERAELLHGRLGTEVRVAGHCGCPSPTEWYNSPYHIGVPLYHVDTQRGLNALAEEIRLQEHDGLRTK